MSKFRRQSWKFLFSLFWLNLNLFQIVLSDNFFCFQNLNFIRSCSFQFFVEWIILFLFAIVRYIPSFLLSIFVFQIGRSFQIFVQNFQRNIYDLVLNSRFELTISLFNSFIWCFNSVICLKCSSKAFTSKFRKKKTRMKNY
jgi:hypothetical protein